MSYQYGPQPLPRQSSSTSWPPLPPPSKNLSAEVAEALRTVLKGVEGPDGHLADVGETVAHLTAAYIQLRTQGE